MLAGGAFLLLGATRRWEWLVDPPKELWFFYSQSLIKAIFGSEGCRYFTIFLGLASIATGALFVVCATIPAL